MFNIKIKGFRKRRFLPQVLKEMKWEGEAALHILHLLAEWLIFLWETYLYAKLFSTPGGSKDSSFTHSNKKPEKVNHYFGFANLLKNKV